MRSPGPPGVGAALRLLRPAARAHRRALWLGTGLAVTEVAVSLAQPWPLKVIVDDVLGSPTRPHDADLLISGAVAALIVLVGLTALADYWSTRLLSSAGLQIGNRVREDVFAHLHRQSLRFHGDHQVGDLAARVTGDVDRTQDMLVQTLAILVPNALLLVGMTTVMTVLDAGFTALALAATPVLVLTVRRSTRALTSASRAARKADGEVAAAATESLSAIHLVQTFSLEPAQEQRFAQLSRSSLTSGLEAVRLQARFSPFVDLSSALSTAMVLWVGAHRVLSGEMSLGTLLVFLSYLGSLYKPIKALAKLGSTLSKGTSAADRVRSVLETEPKLRDRPGARVLRSIRGEVALDHVSFSYGREAVLVDLSLRIKPGESVALIGSTGAGKSSVAALISRLADPDQGRVTFDGIDIREFTLASARAQVSMVLQDCLLLRGTVRDNIACSMPGATDWQIRRAATLALVDEFTTRLPDGLDTLVGERGANLSGGQRQRIAIARAILRDAPILVLDEPTSALDPASEAHLVDALDNLPCGRTRIVIAHRMSTIRTVDRVLTLDHGRLVGERGPTTAAELVP